MISWIEFQRPKSVKYSFHLKTRIFSESIGLIDPTSTSKDYPKLQLKSSSPKDEVGDGSNRRFRFLFQSSVRYLQFGAPIGVGGVVAIHTVALRSVAGTHTGRCMVVFGIRGEIEGVDMPTGEVDGRGRNMQRTNFRPPPP